MKNIVIFGISDSSQLAKFYIENDPKYSDYEVVAFTVDSEFLDKEYYEGLPVIDFEKIDSTFPPSENLLFVPITGIRMNRLRMEKFKNGKNRGYEFFSYISSHATVLTNQIGENCFILEDNTIQPYVSIGDNVVMWSGNHIGHHSNIGNHVYFTSHVVLSGHCQVGDFSWFGVNSTIGDGTKIGESTLLGMGSLVTKDTDGNSVYFGSPARKQNKSPMEVF